MNADQSDGDGLAGQPVFKLPFETAPENYKFTLGGAAWGLRFMGVLPHPCEHGQSTGKIFTEGAIYARVKAAATALPGAYLIPVGGTTGHFAVSASPSPWRLLSDLSGQTSGTIYGPDNPCDQDADSMLELVPQIIMSALIPGRITWPSPATADTDGVHAAHTDDGAPEVLTTGITNPPCPRNITATAGGTAGDIKAVQVIIAGTNYLDEAITETLPVFTVDTAGSVVGALAFKTVTQITIPAHDGTGATTAIGFGDILGLPDAAAARLVEATIFNGVVETTAVTLVKDADEIEKNTADLNSALNASQVDILLYER
jgi:hypothetical protein